MCIDRVRPRRARVSLVVVIAAALSAAVPAVAQSPFGAAQDDRELAVSRQGRDDPEHRRGVEGSPQLPPPARPPKADPDVSRPSASATLPSARSIIDRHIKAIGGREAILKHTSTHATGTVSIPSAGMTGTVEIFTAKPNKSMMKITLAGVGEVQEGFDGTTGWSLSPMSGPMLLEGKQLQEKRFDSDFYGELHDDSRYESMTTVEETTFDGRRCYKLQLVRKGGGEDIEYYDAQTGLKAGSTTTRETPMGTVTATTVESGYRKFGDILQPASVKQTLMGLQQVIALTTVEYDTVPESVFELPTQIKALIK